MPKYAEAMFHLVNDLRTMDQCLCHAYMMNWLANLTSKPNGFKEMDLLQEHQNFWLKVIYSGSSTKRSWKWISMISVSIFVLREVIRKVQCEYQTPYNSMTHTNPSADEDIQTMCDYLEVHRLQSFDLMQSEDEDAIAVHDLLKMGTAYANTASAYELFRDTLDKEADGTPDEHVDVIDHDCADGDYHLDINDLALDGEEFPEGLDPQAMVDAVHEMMESLYTLE
ncbi:hypothetical protein EDD85DRAFT_954792 [Armillaria nabsnona]|nr:hypothetical protein EDD85DRAFT_954792 [Armillaria nabsnona]